MSNGDRFCAQSCPVCDSREVRIDEVEHGGWLLLAECPLCDHRWTRRAEAPMRAPVRVAEVAVRPEVANAA